MIKPETCGPERVEYQSRLFTVIKQPTKIGEKQLDFEVVRRSPGVRVIIVKDNKILLTKEYRWELNGDDYRLPGGKVYDTTQDFENALKGKQNILNAAIKAAEKECEEETGLKPVNIKHFHTTSPGALVVWDLYYFVADSFETGNAAHNHLEGEVIEPVWKTFDEVKHMCINGDIKEDRTVAVLLRFLLKQ